MKKLFIIQLFVVHLVLLWGVNQTFTIDQATLQGIRDATDVPESDAIDPVIWRYYHNYSRETRESHPESFAGLEERSYNDTTFHLQEYAIIALDGLIDDNATGKISEVITFLVNEFDWEDFKLQIYDPLNNNESDYEIDDPYQRGLHMAYGLNFIAYMCDLSYYYMTQIEKDIINTKLNSLIDWAIDDVYGNTGWRNPAGWCQDESSNELLPRIQASSFRLINISGIGYCCIVAEDSLQAGSRLQDFVMEQFFSSSNYPTGTDLNGFQDYGVTNNGMYIGGLSYQNRALYLTPWFFTALKRKHNFNFWDTDFVKGMIKQTMIRIDPDFNHITQEDDGRNRDFEHRKIEKCLLHFYYQNTNDIELRKSIRWYVHRAKDNYGDWPRETNEHNTKSFDLITCFEPSTISSMPITEDNSFPDFLENGTYTDSELTILRPSSSSSDIISVNNRKKLDIPYLSVNHENSFSHNHYNPDQTHFQLFYKGEYLIVDTGYKTWYDGDWGRLLQWFRSPYAKNMIIINPDSTYIENSTEYVGEFSELTEWYDPDQHPQNFRTPPRNLNTKDPIGYTDKFSYHSAEDINNPSYKDFLYGDNFQTHLKVSLQYENKLPDCEGTANPCDVSRNYYMVDEEFFIIYDNINNLSSNINKYRNQIHLNPSSTETFYPSDSSLFESTVNNVHLYGAMGARNFFYNSYDSKDINLSDPNFCDFTGLPIGWNRGMSDSHSRLRVTSEGINEQFLTLLIPSENSDTPIQYVSNTSVGYGVCFDIDLSDNFKSYAAINSGDNFLFVEEQIKYITSANFFLVKLNEENIEDTLSAKKLIINGDNHLKIRDNSEMMRFPDQIIYDSDYSSEEIMVEWSDDNKLYVTHKTYLNDCPKFQILRCGIDPENLVSKTEFGNYSSPDGTTPNERGTIEDNINTLAYDENYFYVNYSYSDLLGENVLTSSLTIHQGTFDGITISGTTQFGLGDIVLKNTILVPENSELVFLPGATLKFNSDLFIKVSGNLIANGTETSPIVFDKYSNDNWEEIKVEVTGNAFFDFCSFNNGAYPLSVYGYVNVNNCTFNNNERGIILESPKGYQITNSEISNCTHTGLIIHNSHRPVFRSNISYNTIKNNHYGIWLYNSSAIIEKTIIDSNNYAGLMCNHTSNPILISSSISNTRTTNYNQPEIRVYDSSYPVVNGNQNDIIFDGHWSIHYASTTPIPYDCSKVWWGTTDENAISNSFYPFSWNVTYTPISLEPNVGYIPEGGSLFKQGLIAEINNDLDLAKDSYEQAILEAPESMEAIWSASRLLSCTEVEYDVLKQYFAQLQENYPGTELDKVSKQNEIFCDRLQSNYQDALAKYEFLLETNQSYLDSIYTQLDIVYTYIEASSGGGRSANLTFKNLKNTLNSFKQAKAKEVELLDLLESQIEDAGIYAPEISKIKLYNNYPNPFNPTTTIKFDLPNDSNVNIEIYNIKGQKVKTVINEEYKKGSHHVIWNGTDANNKSVSSGVYFYKMDVAGKKAVMRKCLLLK